MSLLYDRKMCSVNLVECAKEDWSFGNGIASYAS